MKAKIFVGVKGQLPTTHCFVTARPLENSPVNYDLGGNHYISCNQGRWVDGNSLSILRKKYAPKSPIKSKKQKEITHDN